MATTAMRPPVSARPGPFARLADRTLSRLLKLPPATGSYTVTRGLRIAMRDGVMLVADHYAPTSPALGTLLMRSPYGRGGLHALLFARIYAERGYHVVLQSCRGTFGSGGEFAPLLHEIDDGADTVAWLREQLWFTGRFATIGGSYPGFAEWAILVDAPPELATAVIAVGPHDFAAVVYGTGAFTLNDFLSWSDLVSAQEDHGQIAGLIRAARATKRLAPAMNGLPLVAAGERALDGRASWYREWVTHNDISDPYWTKMRLTAALDRINVPVMLVSGWQDVFVDQTLEQYVKLSARGVEVSLTVGPWTHLEVAGKAAGLVSRESLDWLGEHLARQRPRTRRTPVRIFVTGANEWRDITGWPPAYRPQVLYLQPGGGLADVPPPADAQPTSFRYDPAQPTPTVGGRLLSSAGGYRGDRTLAQRSDVAVFTSEVLSADLEVVGVPVVELVHDTDNPHVDLFVRLSEVRAQGASRNVSDGFVRPHPDRSRGTIRLELDAVAHRFRAGSRVRLIVAGGSHPRFARNLGTGESPASATRMVASRRTIAHGAGGRSYVRLPLAN